MSAIFSGFPKPVIVKDENSRFVYLNDPACELLGCELEAIVGRCDHDFLPKAEAEAIAAVEREIFTTGCERFIEETVTSPEGETKTLLTHKHCVALPYRGSQRRLLLAVISDVTRLRKVERELSQSEAHYRSFVELHPEVPWTAAPNGDVEEVGSAWRKFCGRSVEEATDWGWEKSIHPDDLGHMKERWNHSIRTGKHFDIECRLSCADGSYRWFRSRAVPRLDETGNIIRWYGLLEEIHERKVAEEALRESESRFRMIADSVPVMIWLSAPDGRTTYLNRPWLEFTGQDEEKALGFGWLEMVHPDDRDRVTEVFVAASRARKATIEYRLLRANGSWAWVIDVGVPQLNSQGEFSGYAGSVMDISERRETELALGRSEAFIRSIFDSSPDCVRLLELDGTPMMMNRAGREMFGVAADAKAEDLRLEKIVSPADAAKLRVALTHVRRGIPTRIETPVIDHRGVERYMDMIVAPVPDSRGKPVRALTIWRDVTEARAARDQAERAQRMAERALGRLSTVLESTMDCVIVLGEEWRLAYMNSKARTILRLGDEALGEEFWSLFPRELSGSLATHLDKAFASSDGASFEDFFPALGLWLEVHAKRTEEGLSVFFRDISERRRAEQERFEAQSDLLHMSRHDALTGLPNRNYLRERIERELSVLRKDEIMAVLTLDIDGLKSVNDTYGHPTGDDLLRQVADRLRACLADADTVARVGGDEFVIVRPGLRSAEEAEDLARAVLRTLDQPFRIDGTEAVIGTGIGIALALEHAGDVDQLIKASDVALDHAKAEGVGQFRLFEAGMDADLQERQRLKIALGNAIARQELEIFYQPLVELPSQRITCCEALVRWRHPEKGMISPAQFIPLAEESGAIVQLGAWVLAQACREASGWPAEISVAVNLSPRQFKNGFQLLETVSEALAASQLDPRRLQLEITESVMLEENEANLRVLQEFKRMGVKIAMDDFGTGYSSLGYLRSFPFDKIKIDRSFIVDLPESKESLAIIRAVAGIGGSLGITTTIEGVETVDQLEALLAEGCSEAQGYLFARPMPASEVTRFLQSGAALSALRA